VAGLGGAAQAAPVKPVARFQLRPVLVQLPPSGSPPTTSAPNPAAAAAVASCDAASVEQLAAAGSIPTTKPAAADPKACVVLADTVSKGRIRYYLGPATATGNIVTSAQAEFVSGQGWTVTLTLTPAGSRTWDALAQQQFHRQVAMVVDGVVQSAPTIQPDSPTFSSFGGTAVVSGDFTPRAARRLARIANHR
jgi:preprotein translocase subunit SecD